MRALLAQPARRFRARRPDPRRSRTTPTSSKNSSASTCVDGPPQMTLPTEAATDLLLVIREAIHNAVKHAGVDGIACRVECERRLGHRHH
ncbi:MAG: hypothetical protein R2873_35860 [Caldilineaceae bacterium]